MSNDQPDDAHDATTAEEERRRRRRLLLWWFFGGGAAIAVVAAVLLTLASGDSDDGSRVQASPTVTATPTQSGAVAITTSTPAPTRTRESTPTPRATSTPTSTPTSEPTISPTRASRSTPTATAAPTSTPSPSPTATPTATPTVPVILDISGRWDILVVNTITTGACAGESGDSGVHSATITQDGTALTVFGFGTTANDAWVGVLDGTTVSFGGTRSEDDGTTTAQFTLEVDPANWTLTGNEAWSWAGPGGTCPGSASDVTGTKVG